MKILEAQSATLTNYEVYTHLTAQKARYEAGGRNRRGTFPTLHLSPGNLETVVRELLDYFRTIPSPLAEPSPHKYSPFAIKTLLTRLRPYDLTKAEILMILNLRPTNTTALNPIVEEMGERFSVSQQLEMAAIVGEVLGKSDGDTALRIMKDSAEDARDKELEISRDMETDQES